MIAIISVDSLRNLPIVAQYGFSLISFYVIAALFFFLPLAWITSRLAVQFTQGGGAFLWIEAAFGSRWRYISLSLVWIYNIIWYPTIFAFISNILLSLIAPELEYNKTLILLTCALLFWLITFMHFFGVRMSHWLSTVSAIVGTLIPMFLMVFMVFYWLSVGLTPAIDMHWSKLLPDTHVMHNIAYFSNFLFSLLGLEVIAMYAPYVRQPEKAYPKALLISSFSILLLLIVSSLCLCIVIPPEKISLLGGIIDVFRQFFGSTFPTGAFIVGICIVIGSLGMASSWIIGLVLGLHTALAASFPKQFFAKLNKNGVPIRLLLLQGVIYSLILNGFLLLPNINSAYWLFSALTAQFALIYYVLLFAAAFKLLFHAATKNLTLSVLDKALPLLAVFISFIGLLAGLIPPEDIQATHRGLYIYTTGGSLLFFVLLLIMLKKKR